MPDDSIGKVRLDLETNADPFRRQLDGIAGNSVSMVKNAFRGLGKFVAGAFAVKTLVNFGKASIDLASDLAEVQNVVDVVFGSSAETINNFSKTAITQYGLSELAAKRYSSTMGAMLKSMGLSQDAVLGMSQSITGLAGDMASFYNLNADDAFNKIRSGISGETEPLKQLGINMSVANMEAFALSQGITKSYKSMTQSEQALLRYNYLLSTTADAQGDFARTSDSWANQTRILSEQWKSFSATLGSIFIPILTPVVRMLNSLISKLQIAAAYLKAFVEAVTGVKAESNSAASGMTGIADSATEAGDATVEAAKKASKALAGFDKLNVLSSSGDEGSGGGSGGSGGSVPEFELPSMADMKMTIPEPDVSGVEKVMGKVRGMFSSLKEFVTTAFAPTISSWGGAFSSLQQPIGEAFASISTSITSLWGETLVPFAEYWLGDYIPTMVNSISETLAPIFSDVLTFSVQQFADTFSFACEQVSTWVNDIIIPILELWKKVFSDMCSSIKEEWDKSGGALLEGIGKFFDSIKEIWMNLYNVVLKPVWDMILEGLKEIWDAHLKPLWDNLVRFVSDFAQWILWLWNDVLAPLINWVIKTFGPMFTNAFGAMWEAVKKAIGNISDSLSGVLEALRGVMKFIKGVFTGDWKTAWEGIKQVFKGVWDALVNIVKAPINLIIGFINAMVGGIVDAVNTAIGALNKLSFDVPDWVPVIGGETWGFDIGKLSKPKIPYLADGGIITQPTLAMVGEAGKEAVVPLENTSFADAIAQAILRVLTPLFANNNSTSNNSEGTTVILKIGEYELGRVTVGAINKYHNVIGKVKLEV